MFPIRVKVCSESDLRMLGNLARNIQRVLPVTQADIDAAAALGKGWVVWKVIEVSDPLDNLRGGTQLVIKQNSVQPGQNVRRVIFVSGPGGETVVVGPAVSPLSLPDAVANSLSYVKAFGGTELSGTPTPSTPATITCNNGILKVRHQSGLPLGYTLLDYIKSNGSQYIDTGFMPNQDTSVETKAQLSASSGVRFFAVYGHSSNAPYYGVGFSGSGKWVNQTNASNQVTNVDADTNLHTIYKNKTILYVDGIQIGDSGSGDFTSSYSMYLLAANIGGSVSFISAGKMYYAKIWDDNTLVHNFVPCKNASNVVGMYDTVSGTFFTNAGTGTFTAGTAVSDPVEIYTDGTVETIEDSLNNTATAEMLLSVGDYKDEQNITTGAITRKVGVKVLDGTENWSQATTSQGVYRYRFEPTDAPKLDGGRGHCMSTHFFDIGGVSTQDIGGVFASTTFLYFIPNQDVSTVTGWEQWLANQYAAGTPVITVYPLATPTTESVAGQTLQVQAGDNTLEITQASLLDLELEAEYEQGVQASVEEIEP